MAPLRCSAAPHVGGAVSNPRLCTDIGVGSRSPAAGTKLLWASVGHLCGHFFPFLLSKQLGVEWLNQTWVGALPLRNSSLRSPAADRLPFPPAGPEGSDSVCLSRNVSVLSKVLQLLAQTCKQNFLVSSLTFVECRYSPSFLILAIRAFSLSCSV